MTGKLILADGTQMPRLGQGTWHLCEDPKKRKQELESLQLGIELGMNLIDTAEMYGEGKSESLVGEAIMGIERESIFLVSKVYPHNAGKKNIFNSCENSLKRLGVDFLDMYLLHWRGNIPLAETVQCMEKLVEDGLIRSWGVSNFELDDMKELWGIPDGEKCKVNQVLYHLGSRGVEYELLPWMKEKKVAMMAYCPIAQGGRLRQGMLNNSKIISIAKKHKVSPIQILLGFVLNNPMTIAIPKAGNQAHVKENAEAAKINLTEEDIIELSKEFPAPDRRVPLDME